MKELLMNPLFTTPVQVSVQIMDKNF